MRRMIVFSFLALRLLPTVAGASSPRVIAAAATSSALSAAPVTCLLQPACSGSWSPGSADSGANEGVYVQFENPIDSDTVAIVSNAQEPSQHFILSANGAVLVPGSYSPKPLSGASGRFVVQYSIPGRHVKSVFFRLGLAKGGWRNFSLYSIQFYSKGKQIELALPVVVPASVTATSVLDPAVAYQPANLFDSRYDYAWSTNGKVTSGKGESVEIKFSQPQNLTGMIVWNGYQRSEEHFKTNGRVAKMSISSTQGSETLDLSDKMGGQTLAFSVPLKEVPSVKLTIEEITPGTKYPDVLLSELRFINDRNQIVVPQVTGILPDANSLTEPLVDRSLSSVACDSSVGAMNFQRSFRLRHDGSFVVYGKSSDEAGSKQIDQVLEGNWELRDGAIRIFGKRYADTVIEKDYSQAIHRTPPSIFQSEFKVFRFRVLTAAEKQQLAALIWTRLARNAAPADRSPLKIWDASGGVLAVGEDQKTLLANLVNSLDKINPWTIRSPILADAMLPSDDVGSCESPD
jgi:hypothetical protein